MTPPSETSAIFVSDSSAEADRLSDALRLRGYAVVDVPLSLLVARVAVQRPAAALIDIDADGAQGVVARLRGLPGAEEIALLFLGEGETLTKNTEALGHAASSALARPVDVHVLLAKLQRLVGSPKELGHSAPALDSSASSRLSPSLQSLLREAEENLDVEPFSTGPPLPSPEEEVEAVLPAEVLAALDEPLDDDEDDFSQAGEDGTSPREVTSDGTPSGPRVITESKTESNPARPTVAPRFAQHHELATPRPSGSGSLPPVPLPPLAPRGDAPLFSLPFVPLSPAWSARPPRDPDPGAVAQAPPTSASPPSLPASQVLGEGEAPGVLAAAISGRVTGSLCFESPEGIRRLLLRDGDLVTAASGIDDESLLAFLVARGDLPKARGAELRGKLPAFGRRAGAALIAHGHLEQDQLWPVLRAHAEWIVACVLVLPKATCVLESEPPERLRAEPAVFGGAAGAEMLVEIARRVIPSEQAIVRLGGPEARITEGKRKDLLLECALPDEEAAVITRAKEAMVGELVAATSPELPTVLYVLTLLGVLAALPAASPSPRRPAAILADPLDAEALRTRVRARLELVQEGDYFAVLGVVREATAYEIRRAYLELRRAFEPSRVLTAETADLADDMRLIVEVLDEAYEILRDATRRERYRRAIEAGPP